MEQAGAIVLRPHGQSPRSTDSVGAWEQGADAGRRAQIEASTTSLGWPRSPRPQPER